MRLALASQDTQALVETAHRIKGAAHGRTAGIGRGGGPAGGGGQIETTGQAR
jgi:phosphoenolpyruvate carboxylase